MTEQVKVEQSDRDAAADYLARRTTTSPITVEMVRAGEDDGYPLIQSFARHRLASQQQIVADMAAKLRIAPHRPVGTAKNLRPHMTEPYWENDAGERAYIYSVEDGIAFGMARALTALTPPENEKD